MSGLSGVAYYVSLIILVSAMAALSQFIVSYGSQYLSQRFAYELREDVFGHMMSKKYGFFESETSGNLLSRCTMDIEAARNFVLNLLSQMIPTFLLIMIAFYFLLTLNPVYSLFFLIVVPLLVYLGMDFQKKQRAHWRRIRDEYGVMNERLQENITGQRVVRGFLGEEREIRRFRDTTDTYFQEYLYIAKLRGYYNNLMPLLISIAATSVILYGGYSDIISLAAVGSLVAAVNIFNTMISPVSVMGRLIVWSENARAAIDRINEITQRSDEENVGAEITKNAKPPVIARAVSFSRGSRVILNDISLEIGKGEFVAITGGTGSGKSTLIGMLPRFYDLDSGSVYFNGEKYDSFTLPEIRRRIGLVPQEVSILSGTLRENIAFGNGEYTDEEIEKAAKIAHIADFIDSLPERYNTIVGERGITLSGGQKQRIAIARAVISRPELLIFDDSTSSVDAETELAIFRSIREELKGTSVIVISLRETGLLFADRVLKLEDGRLRAVSDVRKELLTIVDDSVSQGVI
ncbi:MAG: ABC transporter ATP-binding protein [Thermoplasmata archaeon YP2-bin.285]|uniref:ABC transporter ATP-binding protein n=2 Tax=Candidatus Sysuiplasma superficiale TaxID=2823368 RepID=A0A8J7YL81_9ARCH|nr:ABC transporter ATP-binding protein [Candidatus Sysuiplasma superficiale]